jgi:ribonuclease P protein component
MAARYTLCAGERLKREQHIEALFRSGKALSVFPIRIIWRLEPSRTGPYSIRAGFSAPKKKFKRATDRNRIKRQLRDAWRLQRFPLESIVPADHELHIFILFTDKALPDYEAIYEAIGKSILHLQKKLTDAQPAA